jgi:hypothetical protein
LAKWLAPALAALPLLALSAWQPTAPRTLASSALAALPTAKLREAAETRSAETRSAESRAAANRPAADRALDRGRHSWVRGGVLFVPSTFASAGGDYDLLIHFHGNTAVVRESVEVAGLNTIVVVVNLGEGSRVYSDFYRLPGSYERLLAQVERRLVSRGLERPRLRRVALSSWSAGYGALSKILALRKGDDPLDAVMVSDGIHTHYLPEAPDQLNPRVMAPYAALAARAARGDLLFSITHTEVDPRAYASAEATSSYLLEAVGGERYPRYSGVGRHVQLAAAEGAVAKKKEKRMVLESEGRVGDLHVRGYLGETKEHHMAHLLQMAGTVLDELAERWRR